MALPRFYSVQSTCQGLKLGGPFSSLRRSTRCYIEVVILVLSRSCEVQKWSTDVPGGLGVPVHPHLCHVLYVPCYIFRTSNTRSFCTAGNTRFVILFVPHIHGDAETVPYPHIRDASAGQRMGLVSTGLASHETCWLTLIYQFGLDSCTSRSTLSSIYLGVLSNWQRHRT